MSKNILKSKFLKQAILDNLLDGFEKFIFKPNHSKENKIGF